LETLTTLRKTLTQAITGQSASKNGLVIWPCGMSLPLPQLSDTSNRTLYTRCKLPKNQHMVHT